MPCPCADQALCRPLSPQPPKNRSEVIAYPRSISGGYGQDRSDWRQYDWSKVTVIGLYNNLGNHACGCHTFEHPGDSPCNGWQPHAFPDFCCLDAELLCAAHANNVRVLIWDGGQGGCNGGSPSNTSVPCSNTIPSPINGLFNMLRAAAKSDGAVWSHAAIDAWAAKSAAYVAGQGMDGVNLDIEGLVNLQKAGRDAMTYGICALQKALDKAIPGSMLTLTEAATPFASGVHGVSLPKYGQLDMPAVDKCIDFFQPGVYCTCVGGPPPLFAANRSSLDTSSWGIPPGSLTRGNMPMTVLQNVIDSYGRLGIAPDRLSLLVPWFACDFQCKNDDCTTLVHGPTLPEEIGGSKCEFPYGPFVPPGIDPATMPPGPTGGPGYAQVGIFFLLTFGHSLANCCCSCYSCCIEYLSVLLRCTYACRCCG